MTLKLSFSFFSGTCFIARSSLSWRHLEMQLPLITLTLAVSHRTGSSTFHLRANYLEVGTWNDMKASLRPVLTVFLQKGEGLRWRNGYSLRSLLPPTRPQLLVNNGTILPYLSCDLKVLALLWISWISRLSIDFCVSGVESHFAGQVCCQANQRKHCLKSYYDVKTIRKRPATKSARGFQW